MARVHNRVFDGSPDAVWVFIDLRIPKAKYRKAATTERFVTRRIFSQPLRGAMLASVQLDNQPRFEAREVDHLAAQWDLPAKLGAMLLPHIAERAPEFDFLRRHVPAELTREIVGHWIVS